MYFNLEHCKTYFMSNLLRIRSTRINMQIHTNPKPKLLLLIIILYTILEKAIVF